MLQTTLSQFIKTSELYLRLTEKDRSAFNIADKTDSYLSESVSFPKSNAFSDLGNSSKINSPCSR